MYRGKDIVEFFDTKIVVDKANGTRNKGEMRKRKEKKLKDQENKEK